jgi:hypothetical protein
MMLQRSLIWLSLIILVLRREMGRKKGMGMESGNMSGKGKEREREWNEN